jgi:hypothetical protein
MEPWREALDSLLLINADEPSRERLTLMRIFEALRDFGYEGGYDAVRRYARAWRSSFIGGDQVWCYVLISRAGVRRRRTCVIWP